MHFDLPGIIGDFDADDSPLDGGRLVYQRTFTNGGTRVKARLSILIDGSVPNA